MLGSTIQMVLRQIGSVLILILIGLCLYAQEEHPDQTGAARIGAVVQASALGENIRQVWAYADPNDGRHMIVCGMVSYPEMNALYGYIYSSSDAGATWHRALLDDATRWVSEESCAYGQDGRAYFVDGQSDTSTGSPRHEWGHLQIFISHDHGVSWQPAGHREFVDWTMVVALPADKQHAESLVIFGNSTADRVGHWQEKRPVALEASNNSEALSAPVSPAVMSRANFGGGSVTLPDRTALFALGITDLKYKSDPSQHRRVSLFAYRPSDRSLKVRAILRDKPGRTNGLPFIVRDAGRRFKGRLYAAWSENAWAGSDAQLWLATSDNNGYRWSSRAILSLTNYRTPVGCPTDLFRPPPDLRIATNRMGILGVLWRQDAETLLFAASRDGGRTFDVGNLIVRQPIGALSVDDAVPFNEWWLGENIAARQGKPWEFMRTFFDPSHLGLSVRLSKHNVIGDFALTADAKNVFHAFWTAIGANGNYALMTRKIQVGSALGVTSLLLNSAAASSTCGTDTARLQAGEPTPTPPLELSGQADISESLNLQVDHFNYSPESHVVTASVTLMNKSANNLRGPFSLFAVGIHSDFGGPTALNADGVKDGHPFWNLQTVIPVEGLPPKGSSKPIQLRFKIDQFHTVPTGDAVAMRVQVFRLTQ